MDSTSDNSIDVNSFEVVSLCYQREEWFEVSRYHPENAIIIGVKNPDPRPYILVINSYGRLRKLFHSGGYEDLHNGGPV